MPAIQRPFPPRFFVGTILLLVAGLALGAGLVRAEDGVEDVEEVKALQARVDALEANVQYLRSREDALTAWILASEARGKALGTALGRSRTQGFLARSIPVDSRATLLEGLDSLAGALQKDLPALSSAEKRMRKTADRPPAK